MERSPKGRDRQRTSAKRARLYLVELAWLTGAPEAGGWRRFDTDELFVLDGLRIAKARRAARTVLREHAEALRELVGDVDRWWAVVDAKLAWCSKLVAGGGALDPVPLLPPRVGKAFRASAFPDLARDLAIAWLETPDLVERARAWLATHARALAALPRVDGRRVVGVLARLALVGDRKGAATREAGVAALIATLAIDAPHPQAALDRVRAAETALLGQRAAPEPELARVGPRLVRWIEQLCAAPPAIRQRALALAAVADLAPAFAPWQTWERDTAPLLARATDLAGHTFDAKDRARHTQPLIGRLSKARALAPHPLALSDVLVEIEMLASERMVRFHAATVRLLSAIGAPRHALPVHARAKLVVHVARAAAFADDATHPEWLWDAVARALEHGARTETLGPWLPAIDKSHHHWLEYDLVAHAKRRADVERFVEVLVVHANEAAPSADEAVHMARWLAAGLTDPDVIVGVLARVRGLDTRFGLDVARTVVALSEGTSADLAALTSQILELVEGRSYHAKSDVIAFLEHAARHGAGWIVRGALGTKHGMLVDAAGVAASLARAKWPALVRDVAPTWIERYPAPLHAALRRLASVDPEAEQAAAKRLASDLPAPADLEREIAALRASGKAPARLATLERRLAQPTIPSPQRLANLAARLDAAARDLALGRFMTSALARATDKLVRGFALPSEAFTQLAVGTDAARLREILRALLELDPADRALAGMLLRARGGPPPWDLRDEPANRAFLANMRTAKLDPGPWLDTTPRIVRTRSGAPLSLAFADDPLDVFAMGWHFDTCLSPRGGNFFSVIANAADINKRVLYARRDGRVVGRCLFALTDGFALIVFHPYCHDQDLDFTAAVRDFATDLAARIGTELAPRGTVRTLLARDWYDDGARDLAGRFAGLRDDVDLGAIAPEELVARLGELLGRGLDDVTLPLVLEHRSLASRPRHLAPLVPFILASSVAHTRITAARLALDNDDLALADRLLGAHAHAIRLDDHPYPRGVLLARLRPSQTLAWLRKTGPRRRADDRGNRLALAGIALESLQRPRQAAEMYRLALRYDDWLRHDLGPRLAALERD